jgi:site-specific recombinase XerD
VLSLLFNWGKPRGITTINPAADVPKFKRPKHAAAANRPWSIAEFRAVMAALPPELRVALALGGFAGMRQQDVIAVTWASYDGSAIETRQLKTGDPPWVPAHKDLRSILDAERERRNIAAAHKKMEILIGARGKPLTGAGFRSRFFGIIRDLTATGTVEPGLTFHGLRHTAATLLAEAGCDAKDIDAKDIMAVTGHKTVAMAEHYARRANLRKRAIAAIGRLELVDILSEEQVAEIKADATPKPAIRAVTAKARPPAPKIGSASPNARLTDVDVRAIHASQQSHRALAKAYGVSRSLIEQIKSGKVWKHLLEAAEESSTRERERNR